MNFVPRVHGNGFIQLDLTASKRLHVWGHPAIPTQAVPTPLHDHAFGFTSRILLGCLQNERYRWMLNPRGDYQAHVVNVRDREDTTLHGTGEYGNLSWLGCETYLPGKFYTMVPGEIHQSTPQGLTVSIIEKTGPTLSQGGPTPRVFVKRGVFPDNTFHRYALEQTELWAIIADVLQLGVIP